MTFHCVHTWLNIFIYLLLQNNHNCDNQKPVAILVILFECVVCYYVACAGESPWDDHSDCSV